LTKTVKFKDHKYVGDPINAVKIFNEKEADELMLIDIDATVQNNEPNYKMIENVAAECRMPLCYGGGIKTVGQAQKIFGLGVEKIAISSIAIQRPSIVAEIAEEVGNQSVVVVMDVKKKMFGNKYEVFTHNGTRSNSKSPFELIRDFEDYGAGEIVINSIDNDGAMKGYDLGLIKMMRDSTNLPMTVLGGAGSFDDIKLVIDEYKIIGVAAGSLFVFKGKYRAVLINYPTKSEKEMLVDNVH